MRFRLLIPALVALSILAILSLRHAHAAGTAARQAIDDTSRAPVLVELFTSKRCSSCPPADALLERLDRSQPVNGTELIVLSEHVDYWNDIGWKDPFSSHEYSERQSAYAAHFGRSGIYTPQMVVDGHAELVGSDELGAIAAVENETRFVKVPLSLSGVRFERKNKVSMHVEAGPLEPAIVARSANLYLAIADESDVSQ